jgi:hypothetical protein
MHCFIYKSLKKDQLYLYLNQKDDFSNVPETLLANFGKLEFVMELELTPERKLAKEDANKIMDSLAAKGFFVQLPPTIIHNTTTIH